MVCETATATTIRRLHGEIDVGLFLLFHCLLSSFSELVPEAEPNHPIDRGVPCCSRRMKKQALSLTHRVVQSLLHAFAASASPK